ncbi:hypothetical protein AAVH_32457, partial [Aphelenchoides avenae]
AFRPGFNASATGFPLRGGYDLTAQRSVTDNVALQGRVEGSFGIPGGRPVDVVGAGIRYEVSKSTEISAGARLNTHNGKIDSAGVNLT